MKPAWTIVAVVACALLLPLPALAHKPSDSYLALRVDGQQIDGQWDIALRDLDFAIGLDSNQDGDITWGEVKAKHADIAAYALSRLRLGPASAPKTLTVDYRLFFDVDPQHRGLVRIEYEGETRAGILSAELHEQKFTLAE